MTTAMKRPMLHDLIKEAAEATVRKVDIDAEAERQLANLGEIPPQEKTASAEAPEMVPTEYLEKLAGALDYGAGVLEKEADVAETKLKPGQGPNALEVVEAPSGENPVKPGNQGTSTDKNSPPMTPPMQASGVAKDPSNAMATNDAMMHGEQPVEPISNEKTSLASALYAKNMAVLGLEIPAAASPEPPVEEPVKEAEAAEPSEMDKLYAKNLQTLGLEKQAEDALNPAKIAAPAAEATGADPPADASPAEEQVPSEPSDVDKQKALISSNQAAMDYKKVQAKKDPVSDMGDVVTEPAMSAAHDKTLNMVFAKTREAGAKIASEMTRTAAAQALLAKHAAGAEQSKKEKQSMMADKTTAAGASGFSTSGQPGQIGQS